MYFAEMLGASGLIVNAPMNIGQTQVYLGASYRRDSQLTGVLR